ncbi:MAG: nitroreductase [Gammaproteobacteria bacterium]
MNIQNLIKKRRSISSFKSEIPSERIIQKAIKMASWAPNHHLTEPWRFYLLGEETKQAVIELNAKIVDKKKGARAANKKREKWSKVPGWLVVTMTKSSDQLQQQEDYAACACAIQNLSLYLWEKDIGIKWTTGDVTRDQKFYDLIWVDPEIETVVGLIWYGYPDDIPNSKRKPIEEIIVRLP